ATAFDASDVAKHVQLLLVFSAHTFFSSGCAEFSDAGSTPQLPSSTVRKTWYRRIMWPTNVVCGQGSGEAYERQFHWYLERRLAREQILGSTADSYYSKHRTFRS
ncbi:MAG: hypothetical protein ABSG16_23195, partial [Candidatus Acidiferrum sp.]